MPFVSMPGIPGRLYVPERQSACTGKYPCNDCFSCEYCSDDRCRVCRVKKTAIGEKEAVNQARKG
jgi:hypothetical protein